MTCGDETDTWFDSSRSDLNVWIECEGCGSWYGAGFREPDLSPLWRKDTERAVESFREVTWPSCGETRKLNDVKDVMES